MRVNEVLIVAAGRIALADYEQWTAYFCQPSRTFRPTSHLAFYSNNCIHPVVPAILEAIPSVICSESAVSNHRELSRESRVRLTRAASRLHSHLSRRCGPRAERRRCCPSLHQNTRDRPSIVAVGAHSEPQPHLGPERHRSTTRSRPIAPSNARGQVGHAGDPPSRPLCLPLRTLPSPHDRASARRRPGMEGNCAVHRQLGRARGVGALPSAAGLANSWRPMRPSSQSVRDYSPGSRPRLS
jgi:hypothetical protein